LTRDTEKVTKWFAQTVQQGKTEGPQTGVIKAMTLDGTVIASWSLIGVVPVRWTGPSLNPDSPKVATETIEIAHHGFGTQPPSGQN
jgi:phage tail-like protein